jgi:hypothetical protein
VPQFTIVSIIHHLQVNPAHSPSSIHLTIHTNPAPPSLEAALGILPVLVLRCCCTYPPLPTAPPSIQSIATSPCSYRERKKNQKGGPEKKKKREKKIRIEKERTWN